ncbi:MAG: class I SAM-dependent rRNA methyltransferase [Pirellulales bacterium]
MEYPAVTLRAEKRGTFLARHPWVLDKSLQATPAGMSPGEVIDLVTPDGRWMARGVWNGHSRIRVRLYSWDPQQALDAGYWHAQLAQAVGLRRQLGLIGPRQATRLVFSEGDGLSGLIVDQYAGYLVVQYTALAMQQRAELIVPWLIEHLQPTAIQVRIDQRTAKAEGMEAGQNWVYGTPPEGPVEFDEHGVRLQVDLNESQKTGYYVDQRDNRREAARYVAGKRVLDVCTYVGGFALAAGRAGAAEVLGIDSSQRAVDAARQHAELNELPQVRFETGEMFERLEGFRVERRRFDVIVLDPPRFAGSRQALRQALQAYHRLNRLAVELLEPGGILVTCSCSGLVTREDFRQMLVGVARKCHRDLQLLDQRGAGPDHPVRLSCPETEYLKCFILRA